MRQPIEQGVASYRQKFFPRRLACRGRPRLGERRFPQRAPNPAATHLSCCCHLFPRQGVATTPAFEPKRTAPAAGGAGSAKSLFRIKLLVSEEANRDHQG
jgi:hypothetical protein